MDKRKYFRESTSESGVALVFALAMLALLLIMLIGFLASAIFEQRIAYNQSGQSITRTIARSALQQASNVLAVDDDNIRDEIPAFTGYGDDGSGSLDADTVRRMAPVSSVNTTTVNTMDNNQANERIEKLLKQQGLNLDNYYWEKDNKPQWVPMIVEVGTEHSHITGRFAYTIIPNLGIEPNLLNENVPARRIGGRYDELTFDGLDLKTSNWKRIFKKDKWMSLDILGSRYVLGNDSLGNPWKDYYLTKEDKARYDFYASREALGDDGDKKTTFMELVNTYFTTDQDLSVDYDADRIKLADVGAKAKEIAGFIADGTLKEQIAANIVDFVDKESGDEEDENEIPTSDVTVSNWLSSTNHPTCTGNEMTPYLNQLAVKLKVDAKYTETHTDIPETENKNIKQTLTVTLAPDVVAELINIYNYDFKKSSKVKLDKLTIEGTVSIGETEDKQQKYSFTIDNPETGEMTLGKDDEKKYDSATLSSPPEKKALDSFVIEKNNVAKDTKADDINLKVTVDNITFTRAVVIHNDKNVDYTKFDIANKNYGMVDPFNVVITPGTPADPNNPDNPDNPDDLTSTWTFAGSDKTQEDKNEATTATSEEYWKGGKLQAKNDGVPNLGKKNEDSNPKNADLKEEKDLEVTDDPAKVSTGYIRNGAMQSVWELGFIHRGKPWQTINLKSADHTNEKTYLNDAVLLDEIAFYDPEASADDKEKEKTKKYNINYPYTHIAAFGPLVKGLKYCPVSENIIADDGKLYPEDGTLLTEDQWTSLRKWIAWKCYEANGDKPSKFDVAKNYHFYRHRGYLANVITDWAINCADSPYHGKDLMDSYLEEIVSKIAPLTRAGEPYEYFTIYAVAQSIKDVGGLNSNKKISRYGRNGALQEGDCQQGKWEEGFDEVTGEVFLVARVRRELIHCEDKDKCKEGQHDEKCKYAIHVIESYTINSL